MGAEDIRLILAPSYVVSHVQVYVINHVYFYVDDDVHSISARAGWSGWPGMLARG